MTPPPLVLASASPRRRGLLRALGVPVAAVRPAALEEVPHPGEAPVAYARRLAVEKAAAVCTPGAVVLAADTVVHLDGAIFEKPADEAQARAFLTALAGRWHRVTTGWCVLPGAGVLGEAHQGAVTAEVRFRPLSSAAVAAYVATGESMDKAGAYGVQGLGAALVEQVRGSYSCVVGLPLNAVLEALSAFQILPLPPSAPES